MTSASCFLENGSGRCGVQRDDLTTGRRVRQSMFQRWPAFSFELKNALFDTLNGPIQIPRDLIHRSKGTCTIAVWA